MLLLARLLHDEAGFIVSAELILVSTIVILSLVVGLSEIANAINHELEDVASAFGAVNQSFRYAGISGHGGTRVGSQFRDHVDDCDSEFDIHTLPPTGEARIRQHGHF